jgi:hypothetical protein
VLHDNLVEAAINAEGVPEERVKAARPSSLVTPGREKNPELRLYVVYTDLEATKSAFGTATFLARDLNARLVLLIPKVVPYPLPLEAPPVHGEFTDRLLSQPVAPRTDGIAVRVYLWRETCRVISDQ